MSTEKALTAPVESVVIRRGRGDAPKPMNYGDEVPRLVGCPDCGGRGYFLIRPFMTGGTNGAGGLGNMTQCLTCLDCKAYYEQHGELPPEIVKEMEAKKAV